MLTRAAVCLRALAFGLGATVAAGSKVLAQSPAPGAEVRLRSNHEVVARGLLLRADSTGLTLLTHPGDTVTFAPGDFEHADALLERHPHGLTPLWTGVGVGLAIPALLAAAAHASSGPGHGEAYVGVILIGSVTLFVGTVVGVVMSGLDHETWAEFDIRTGLTTDGVRVLGGVVSDPAPTPAP